MRCIVFELEAEEELRNEKAEEGGKCSHFIVRTTPFCSLFQYSFLMLYFFIHFNKTIIIRRKGVEIRMMELQFSKKQG